MTDRVSPRERPSGFAVLHQRWSRLIFLHWRVRLEHIRSLIPLPLELDTFEQEAWVGLIAFTATRMRPALIPPIPWLSSTHQINLRTYVHYDGVPGVWFLSIDASNALAVWAARRAYGLPYHLARIRVKDAGNNVSLESHRVNSNGRAVAFQGEWQLGSPSSPVQPGSLGFFLIERYVLYSFSNACLYRARIHHCPWPLRHATLTRVESTMLTAQGLQVLDDAPLIHAQAQPLNVSIWPRERVRASSHGTKDAFSRQSL